MLSPSDNELITRVGPGTVMGAFMRLHWIPALPSRDLPEPDGPPKRIRLLGENLVAFRTTSGKVGIMAELCPHRRASLFFGRNEENGLRCAYHGWKMDVTGQCMEIPNERAGSPMKDNIRATAYPTEERNGVVWVYMGSQEAPPPLPQLEWNLVSDDQVYLSLRVQACNWLQALEGDIDSSHAPFLHGLLYKPGMKERAFTYQLDDMCPHFEVSETEAGVMIGARRAVDDESYYWRVNQFLLPFHTMIPPSSPNFHQIGHVWVPMDDEHVIVWNYNYSVDGPMLSEHKAELIGGGRTTSHPAASDLTCLPDRPYADYWPVPNKSNNYNIDWEAQRTTYRCGISRLFAQDSGLQESMGAIVDRTAEHLCSSDQGIVRARRRILKDAKAFAETGKPPEYLSRPDAYFIRAVGIRLGRDAKWLQEVSPHVPAAKPLAYEIA